MSSVLKKADKLNLSLSLGQNASHFADNVLKCIFFNENF